MIALTLIGLFISLSLFIIAMTILGNLPFFPRLRPASEPDEQPLISILVPARNEAERIGHTIEALLGQTYLNYEVIVLNDNSTDMTVEVARQAGEENGRFHLIQGRPLPTGWVGKSWACHQLGQEAKGEYLVFTDADVTWEPDALQSLVALAQKESSDLLTIWPTQQTKSWTERLVVPLMSLAVWGYLPTVMVHHSPWAVFAAANGQCLMFRRQAYEAIGGHTAVFNQILDDVNLARLTKANKMRLRMAEGNNVIHCRMYTNWPEVRDGFAKNILAGHGKSPAFLLISTLFHWLLFVWPWIWLLAGGGVWPLLLVLAGIGVRAVTAFITGQRMRDALLMPVSVMLMTIIAGRSIWWQWRGKTEWKGRAAAA